MDIRVEFQELTPAQQRMAYDKAISSGDVVDSFEGFQDMAVWSDWNLRTLEPMGVSDLVYSSDQGGWYVQLYLGTGETRVSHIYPTEAEARHAGRTGEAWSDWEENTR